MEQLSTNDISYEVTSEHSHVNLDESTQNLLSQFQNNPHLSNKDLLSAEIPDPEDEELNLLKRALLLDEEISPTMSSTVAPSISFDRSFATFNTTLPSNIGGNSSFEQSNFGLESFPQQTREDFTPSNNLTLDTVPHNLHYNTSLNNLQVSLTSFPHKLPINSHNLQLQNTFLNTTAPLNPNNLPASIPFSSSAIHPSFNNLYKNDYSTQNVSSNTVPFPVAHTFHSNPHITPPSLPRTQFSSNEIVQTQAKLDSQLTFSTADPIQQPPQIANTPKKKKADAIKTPNEVENAGSAEIFLGNNGIRFQLGDFILLNPIPFNNDQSCVVQLQKVVDRNSKTFSGSLYKFGNQMKLNTYKSFQPSEIIRTLSHVKFSFDDIIDRCFVLPENEFNDLDDQVINSYKIFLLRFRYEKRNRDLVKARNLNVLLGKNIKDFKSLLPSKKNPSTPKRVRFSVSEERPVKLDNTIEPSSEFINPNNILFNPNNMFVIPTQPKVVSSLQTAPDFSLSASRCPGFNSKENSALLPCNNRNNVKWFTTPPLHPPPSSLEVAHSLDYLVHLARKRKATVSNLTV